MQIDANFKFNKAGQGAFYTGYFSEHMCDSHFSVVYDCGTSTSEKEYIRKAIWKFKARLLVEHNNQLDLLMISHFDDDHINEIKTLIENLSKCETIVLPYLYPEERLLVYLAQVTKKKSISQDYVEFLSDPYGFVTQFGNIGQVIFLDGNDENTVGAIDNPDLPDLPREESPKGQEVEAFQMDDGEIKMGVYSEDLLPPEFKNLLNTVEKNKVFLCKDNCRYFIKNVWRFYFFNKKNSQRSLVEEFVERVKSTIPQFDGFENNVNQLRELFKWKKELAEIYKDVFKEKNLNPTSLVVLHGPLQHRETGSYFKRHYHPDSGKTDTLLTGDLYLEGITWPAYIKDNYSKISFLQIPHHGSKEKWDAVVLNSPGLKYPVIGIINFGLGNSYKHPTPKVVDDIKKMGWRIKLAHELKSFRYNIIIK
jgi:hypothetical protein